MVSTTDNDLLAKRLIIVSGKGGVGKSTAAASLALLALRQGKRVMVVEIDTIPTVAQLLGNPAQMGYTPTEVRPGLSVMNINGSSAVEDYLSMKFKSRTVLKVVLRSKFYNYFVAAAPGLKELMCVGKLWDLVENQRDEHGRPIYDLVLADMPATGHGFSHLRMPQTAVDTLKIGFVKEEAAKVLRLLQDDTRTAFVIVTLAEEMPVNEAIEMRHLVTGTLKFGMSCLIVNGVYPELLDGAETEEGLKRRLEEALGQMEGDRTWCPMLEGALSVQRRRAMNRHYIELLRAAFDEPLIVLPFLFTRNFGPESIDELADRLGTQISPQVPEGD